MEHAPSICFNHSEMVGEIAENAYVVGVGSKKAFEDSFADMVEEFSHGDRI